MSELIDLIDDLDRRITMMTRLARTLESIQLEQQADLIMPGGSDGERRSGSHADPTPAMIARLAGHRGQMKRMLSAVEAMHTSTDKAASVFDGVLRELSASHGQRQPEKLTCPGWPVEEFADRIGGCGKVSETYRRRDGSAEYRRHGLCSECRKRRQAETGEWMGEAS